jgi:predicted CXXCH cytochrome family protein
MQSPMRFATGLHETSQPTPAQSLTWQLKNSTVAHWSATIVHYLWLEDRVSYFPQFENLGRPEQKTPSSGAVPPFCSPILRFALLLTLVAFCSPAALAGVHPIPLEKNTDAAKCVECHEDKTKGKAVHSAIAMGCLSCHEVRVNKDATYIKLITTTPAALCLTCHGDKDSAKLKGTVHSPAVRDCLTCHDPHNSDNKNQLKKTLSGSTKDDNLCLSCHTQGLNVPAKGSRHAALDMGCDTCHTTHKVGAKGQTEFDFHLTKALPALCIDCHDPKDAGLQKAHQNQPFGSANCLECHDPHSSAAPKLMARFMHPPFADKSCEMCHAPAKDGKVVLAQASVKELCVTCHDDKAKLIDSAKVQHPGAAGDCTDCHNPHASKYPGLPKTNGVEICLGCHSDQAEMMANKKVLHQPAFVQGCATCHEPHGSANQKLLRASGNALCLECHGPDSSSGEIKDAHLITIFSGKVRLPDNYFGKNKVAILPIKNGKGHPTPAHPVEDIRDLNDLTKIKTAINCLSCHQPHAGGARAMLIKDQKPGLEFCRGCHKGSIGDQIQ